MPEQMLAQETRAAQAQLEAGDALAAAQRMEAALGAQGAVQTGAAPTDAAVAAWNALGSARVALSLWAQAEEAFWQVVQWAPDTFPCWYNLLVCACRSKAGPQVVGSRWRVASAVSEALAPEGRLHAASRIALELAFQGDPVGNAAFTEQAARRWLALGGGDDASEVLADGLSKLGRHAEVVTILEGLVARHPESMAYWTQLGFARVEMRDLQGAQAAMEQARQLQPDSATPLQNLSMVLRRMGGPAEQLDALARQAVALAPEQPGCYMLRANQALKLGRWAEGFADYEWRFKSYEPGSIHHALAFKLQQAGVPLWAGESLRGRHVLVFPEQGFGDWMMTARLMPLLLTRCGVSTVSFMAEPSLKRYARALEAAWATPALRCVESVTPGQGVDVYLNMLSLMHVCAIHQPEDVPAAAAPVLDADTLARWQRTVPTGQVGIVWRGNGTHEQNRFRSIALEAFVAGVVQPLLSAGVQLVSLQKDVTDEERQHLQALGVQCDWIGQCADWYDSAALVQQLAAVVGVDTALIHLSGTLGVPTVMMNRIASLSDWRWLWQRADSPWYPSLRIVTQTALGEWNAPMAQAVQAVKAMQGAVTQAAMQSEAMT